MHMNTLWQFRFKCYLSSEWWLCNLLLVLKTHWVALWCQYSLLTDVVALLPRSNEFPSRLVAWRQFNSLFLTCEVLLPVVKEKIQHVKGDDFPSVSFWSRHCLQPVQLEDRPLVGSAGFSSNKARCISGKSSADRRMRDRLYVDRAPSSSLRRLQSFVVYVRKNNKHRAMHTDAPSTETDFYAVFTAIKITWKQRCSRANAFPEAQYSAMRRQKYGDEATTHISALGHLPPPLKFPHLFFLELFAILPLFCNRVLTLWSFEIPTIRKYRKNLLQLQCQISDHAETVIG